MDAAAAAGEIAKLKGRVLALSSDDKEVIALVAFVCEVLCKHDPGLRDVLTDAIDDRLEEEFGGSTTGGRARTLHAGLEAVKARIA